MIKEIIVGVCSALITALAFWAFSGIRDIGNSFVPRGAVSAFNAVECPNGWKKYDQASGRYITGIGKTKTSNTTMSLGQQGGTNRIEIVSANLPKIDFQTPIISPKWTSRGLTERQEGMLAAVVEPKVQKIEIGNSEAIPLYPEYVALRFCEKT